MSSLHCLEKVSVHAHVVYMRGFAMSERLLMALLSSNEGHCLLMDLVSSKQVRYLLMALFCLKKAVVY